MKSLFLTYEEVIEIHADQIARYGGPGGIRDDGLLRSALAQPEATFAGALLHPTLEAQAAAYLFHTSLRTTRSSMETRGREPLAVWFSWT